MADPNEAADPDPFAKFDVTATKPSFEQEPQQPPPTAQPPKPANENADPFTNFDLKATKINYDQEGSTALGALGRGVVRGAAPAIGSFPAIGAGAELGFTVGGPWGALAGGIAGGLGAGYLIGKAQEWGLKQLPESWKEAIGQDDRQQQLDTKEHAGAAFLGGLLPYAITMRPGGLSTKAAALPDNATALQKVMAHPVTARVFGGALMGGMELGQEAIQGEKPDWTNVAIATGFGLVFNKPTRIGERLTEVGGSPVRVAFGREGPAVNVSRETQPAAPTAETPAAAPTARPANITEKEWNEILLGQRSPTVAEASDLNVAGPGTTEATFMGGEERTPQAALTAHDAARTETSVLQEPKRPDVHEIARQHEPELFDQYDSLLTRQAEFRKWINEFNVPPEEHFHEIEQQRAQLQAQLEQHITERQGYEGGKEARRIRAQIRDLDRERQTLTDRAAQFRAGQAEETADLAAARKHLMDTEYELRDLGPKVQAAYGRAADAVGAGTVPPAELPQPPEAATPPVPAAGPPAPPLIPAQTPPTAAAATTAKPIEAQKAFIAEDVARQMVAASRPADEAQAAGQLIAARYEARSARLKGLIGTPEELYRRESAEIRGPGGRRAPPAPGTVAPPAEQRLAAEFKPGPAPKAPEPEPAEHEITTTEVRQKGPRGAAARDPSTWSAMEFLVSKGGISPDERNISDLRSIFGTNNKFVPGFGQLIRPGGMSFDRALEALVEAGYIHDEGRVTGGETKVGHRDLTAILEAENRGQKQYRQGQETAEKAEDPQEREHYINGAIDDALKAADIDPATVSGKLRDRVVEIIDKEGVSDPVSAWEKAVMEQDEHGARAGDFEPRDEFIPGWDVADHDAGAARGEGEAAPSPADQERAGVGGAARPTGEGATEPGAEGQPQHLIPGVEPVSDRELAQHGAEQPLRGGDEPADGLFAERGQQELFQGAQGKIRLLDGRKPIITLMKDANASTFIHETGHQFLEELVRDSQHPNAPEDLKADVKTTMRWLGAKADEDLKTSHHERFARGFEQYLREGTAPSKELAGVFAQFKDWLLRLYQTLKGLGKPINEDIRGVFDRMLATEPQRTVLAPGREPGTTLADLHEADAKHTPPAEAAVARDRIVAEALRAESELPLEVQNEIQAAVAAQEAEARAGAEPAGEGAQRPGAAGEVGEPSDQSKPQPAGGAGGEESGAELRGGEPAQREGAGVSGSERGPDGGGSDANPLAPNPARVFEPKEPRLVDKAGNIRIENLTSVEDVAQAIRDSAERNADFRAVRGQATMGEMQNLANDVLIDPHRIDEAQLAKLFGGYQDMAPKIWALRKALVDSAQIVSDAMKLVREDPSDANAAAMALAMTRHDMLQSTLSRTTAESGRTLGMAYRNLEGWEAAQNLDQFMRENTGKTLYQLKMIAKLGANLDSPAKVSKFLRDAQKRSFPGMVLEYWINGLISGVATHTTYMMGNTLLGAVRAIPETAVAAALGKAREARGEAGAHVQIGEVGARVGAAVRGLPAAIEATLEAGRSGVTTLLPSEKGRPTMPFAGDSQLVVGKNATNDPVTWGDVRLQVAGIMRGLRDGIVANAALLKAGGDPNAPTIGTIHSPLGQIPDIGVRGVNVLPLGTALRVPSRAIAAIHSFFRSVNYSMEKGADAYRTAAMEGLKGDAFDRRAAEIRNNPDEARMEKYRFHSTEQTLMGQGGDFTKRLSALMNVEVGGWKPLKFIDPFVHISSNIIKQTIIDRTPVGLLSPELRADLRGRVDPVTGQVDVAARDMAQAKMLVGSALGMTFAGLASQGLISGSGPKDRNEAAMWRLAGNQAHSVRIGDTWFDMHRLGPLGMLLGISADLHDVAHKAADGEYLDAAAHLHHAITQNVLDESFMRGPASLIEAIEDPDRYGEAYVKNMVASFVPYSVGLSQQARAVDPYTRQARTVVDTIRNKIPGHLDRAFGAELLPKRDIWGEPMPNPDALVARGLTAIYARQMSEDPVNRAMIELGIGPAPVQRKIRNVDLDDQQYDDFARLSGRMTKQRLDAIVRSPDWQQWPPNIRATVAQEVIKQSREAARGVMMMKYPAIVRDATQARKDAFTEAPEPIK